ncbi:arylphorin subunit alpha-like [Neodiprion virginianus]|uniref:arylphorin subunit alpha-like n=1 Tax=Neodiprion virginianus TaxID=2961670 RepID=UPI001EE6B853|nr:arylphorin subunit alpha-like [Neodiprion virginianus]
MIRQVAILAVAAFCLAASDPVRVRAHDNDLALRLTYDLVWRTQRTGKLSKEVQDNVDPNFSIPNHLLTWPDKEALADFWARYQYGMLPPGAIFSIYYPDQLEEAVSIFKVMHTAANPWLFFQFSVWAFKNVNREYWTYALNMAIMYRDDFKSMAMPSPHTIFPNYFFNTDVLHQLHTFRMDYQYEAIEGGENVHEVVVPGNYTNWYITGSMNPESNLTYYLEDPDLNNFYAYLHVESPFWMSSTMYNQLSHEFRGSVYFWVHHMLINRYRMERLSHRIPMMETIDWKQPIAMGYDPQMTYSNGLHFPRRDEWTRVPMFKHHHVQHLEKYESRVMEVAESGIVVERDGNLKHLNDAEGLNIFGNIVEGNNDSWNSFYYGSVDHLSRHILGFCLEPENKYQILPSALEHASTSMRDPGFYRIYDKIDDYYRTFMKRLGPYTKNELASPGITVTEASVSKLVTYFEYTNVFVTGVNRTADNKWVSFYVRQRRLNHHPFDVNIKVHTDEATKASVSIFFGPKYDQYGRNMTGTSKYFYQVDYWVTDLKSGDNEIIRKSTEFTLSVVDHKNDEHFYKTVNKVVQGVDPVPKNPIPTGFPNRLVLPRGRPEGMKFQIFVDVRKFDETKAKTLKSRFFTKGITIDKPFGFPLDRPMKAYTFSLPNMYLFTTDIHYYEDESKLNLTA